jgi:hypothetical protein
MYSFKRVFVFYFKVKPVLFAGGQDILGSKDDILGANNARGVFHFQAAAFVQSFQGERGLSMVESVHVLREYIHGLARFPDRAVRTPDVD